MQAYLSSIQRKNLTSYKFITNSSQMTSSRGIQGLFKLMLVSSQPKKVNSKIQYYLKKLRWMDENTLVYYNPHLRDFKDDSNNPNVKQGQTWACLNPVGQCKFYHSSHNQVGEFSTNPTLDVGRIRLEESYFILSIL